MNQPGAEGFDPAGVKPSLKLRWYLNGAPLLAIAVAIGVGAWTCRVAMTRLYGWPVPRPDSLSERAVQALPFFGSFLIPSGVALLVAMLFVALPFKLARGWTVKQWLRYTVNWGRDVYPR